MRQYWQHKQQAGEALLLFRMGDFYELFYDDAETAARVLGIALTSRDKGRTPLAGIPYHALDGYLGKLVRAGYKVAISEQVSDPKTARGVVDRAVVRIVTPGTLTDEALLDRTQSNVLAAVCADDGDAGVGLASVELSTGEITVQLVDETQLIDELARLAPAEVLLCESPRVGRNPLSDPITQRVGAAVSERPASDFNPQRAQHLIEQQFEVRGLIGFGFDRMDASLQAAGALLAYVRETQQGAAEHLRPPRRHESSHHLLLDQATLRCLEIERTMRTNQRPGSLAHAVDLTCNPMGARLVRRWLCWPLRNPEHILPRQRLIEALRLEDAARARIRTALREMGDLERMTGRIGVQRTHPRELRALGDGLTRLPDLRAALALLRCDEADALAERLDGLDDLAQRLTTALHVEAPSALREGGIFNRGQHAELDRLRTIGRDGQTWLAEYQAAEVARTGIPTLKVGFNQVFGYYIEISNPHKQRVPPEYVRKQTIKNAERYITDALKQFETEALTAESRANELEYELFCKLRDDTALQIPRLQQAAGALASIDVLAGWAELALRRQYVRPEFAAEPVLEIEDGRHPVLDLQLERGFVPNDTLLQAKRRSDEATERRREIEEERPLAEGNSCASGAESESPPSSLRRSVASSLS